MEETDYRRQLTPEQYRVMREKGTEVAHTGRYWDHHESGIYACAACGNPLFISLTKFDAKDGWPAFTRPVSEHSVEVAQSDGAVSCIECRSHIGFRKESKHFCVNSIALKFHALPDIEWETDEGDGDGKKTDTSGAPASGAKTISITIGGITIGAVVGAGAMSLATPVPACIVPDGATPLVATTTQTQSQPKQSVSASSPGMPANPPKPSSAVSGGASKPSQQASQSPASSSPGGIQTSASSSPPAPPEGTPAPSSDGTI